MNLKFGVSMSLHNILDEFKGQGHRSKFKVTILENVIFFIFLHIERLMICVCRSIMAKGLWGEGTLQHGSREVRQRSGIFIA